MSPIIWTACYLLTKPKTCIPWKRIFKHDYCYFFGTENFAAAILAALLDNKNFEVVGVVTAPDRPVGRHQVLQESPVKILAEKYNLQVLQPETLKISSFQSRGLGTISNSMSFAIMA